MSCDAYGNCVNQKKNQLRYPLDINSLYANRIYDNQTANRRCYVQDPINIVEGFGTWSVWDIIKLVVVVLLILLLVSFATDYFRPTEVVQVGGLATPSMIELSQITNLE